MCMCVCACARARACACVRARVSAWVRTCVRACVRVTKPNGKMRLCLDPKSSYRTTFNTPYGRHSFLRLPFGLICAQDVFQKKVDGTFSDIPGVTGISYDIIVVGFEADGSDHDANLAAVLERARATGLRFNDKKVVVRCKRIPFFGNIIGAEGIEPDPAKVTAICNMKANYIKEL